MIEYYYIIQTIPWYFITKYNVIFVHCHVLTYDRVIKISAYTYKHE